MPLLRSILFHTVSIMVDFGASIYADNTQNRGKYKKHSYMNTNTLLLYLLSLYIPL
jgi:hypothetical protein